MYTQSQAVFIPFNTTGRIDKIHPSYILTSPSGTCNIYGMQPNYQLRCTGINNSATQVTLNPGVFTSDNGRMNERTDFFIMKSVEPLTVSFRLSSSYPPFLVYYYFSMDVLLTWEELTQFITVGNGIVSDIRHEGKQGLLTVCPQHSGNITITMWKCRCVNFCVMCSEWHANPQGWV